MEVQCLYHYLMIYQTFPFSPSANTFHALYHQLGKSQTIFALFMQSVCFTHQLNSVMRFFFLNTQSSTRRICAWIPNEQARGDCAKSWHEDEFCRGTRDETEPDAR